MTSEQIRKRIEATWVGESALKGFENQIGEIEFERDPYCGYSIFPKGSQHFSDDVLCTVPARDIEGLILYMSGALAYMNGSLQRKLIPKGDKLITYKKLTDWEFDDNGDKREWQVQAAFQKWYSRNLEITHGSGRLVVDIFGLPYTSSGSFAALWNCQGEAYLKSDSQWKFSYLAISVENDILVGFDRENTGKFDSNEIVIGKVVI